MTETLGQHDMSHRLAAGLQRFGAMLGKVGFGLFLIAAAIAALVATTFIGLMLAIAAVFLTFAHSLMRPRRKAAQNEDGTLEARQTADGWVIET
ncbi:MAG TPA: hypothetical protein VGO52_13210 [Hyphomonadaceae bacterium]|jgi:uncharacterized membrane protein|nr:hypothetical protein [Hyphomonadaceae bacterium]